MLKPLGDTYGQDIITPPTPLPTRTYSQETLDRVTLYMSEANWKCPNCGSIVFGHTKICPYNRPGLNCRTSRPSDVIERLKSI